MSTQTHESSSRETKQRVEEGLDALRVGLGPCVMRSTWNVNRGGGKSVPEAVWVKVSTTARSSAISPPPT